MWGKTAFKNSADVPIIIKLLRMHANLAPTHPNVIMVGGTLTPDLHAFPKLATICL